ncbi:conserved hypothetical protein [Perkinsus marinus ATCC 50983]|uniref:Anaphase-promoting complex subunit 4 WD40 domain-containing protein n=1 Tax=Perkinsus marinus (strain ATCC 50983 / TXsc) TaxID=423536 RepID=C5L402_PERM5|nr:conserved hypothetical protein [Perkinsus marinus ATCC 50983]EER08731.1 conserved hypothetical protein [Perkinsus marinus ATCC 50983]|eukprot:XP_002776915.1 conserved hypothetical protein [Perkinsus marinus ATCC 50983]
MVLRPLLTLKEEYFGSTRVMFRWDPSASRLACIPAARPSNLFLVNIAFIKDVMLEERDSPVSSFEWDRTGDILALIQKGTAKVTIYHYNEDRLEIVDCSGEDPSFIAWNRIGPQLAIGMSKGNISIYNSKSMERQLIAGKHGRMITCGAWTLRGLLMLGSEDRIISLSDSEGETLRQTMLRSAPTSMKISDDILYGNESKSVFEKGNSVTKCCVRTAKDTLTVLEIDGMTVLATIKLTQKYRSIVDFGWFGDEQLCIGYVGGHIVVTSSRGDEAGQELFQMKPLSSLDALALCFSALSAAVAGDGCVKLIDLIQRSEESDKTITVDDDEEKGGIVSDLVFSRAGQTITFSLSTGCIRSYLLRLPSIITARGSTVAWMSSLREITFIDVNVDNGKDKKAVQCEEEPRLLGVGPDHIAAGEEVSKGDGKLHSSLVFAACGRRIFYYSRLDTDEVRKEYPDEVTGVEMSATYAAVLVDRKMLVEEDCRVNEYRHTDNIIAVYPNNLGGVYTAFIDIRGVLHVYNAVTEVCMIPIKPEKVGKIKGVVWDLADPMVFVVVADDIRGTAELGLHTCVVFDIAANLWPSEVDISGVNISLH